MSLMTKRAMWPTMQSNRVLRAAKQLELQLARDPG